MGMKCAVKVVGEPGWTPNGLTFATEKEAMAYGFDLSCRWFKVVGYKAVSVAEPANAAWEDGKLVQLTPPTQAPIPTPTRKRLANYKYDYYTVDLRDCLDLDDEQLRQVAIDSAREAARMYKTPANWTARQVKPGLFRVCRKTYANQEAS